MLAIAKRVLGQGYSFATVRSRLNKQSAANGNQEAHEKDVFKSYRKQVEKSSILRQFREDVFRRSELTGDWDPSKKMEEDDRKLRKMLKVDREQMLQKVSSIEARVTQNRSIFDENTGRSLLSDYGNYKAYEKVYPVIDDRNLGDGEFLQDSQLTANLYKFIDKLPEDYQEKHEVQSAISFLPVKDQGMTIAEYGEKLQKQINEAQIRKNRMFENHKLQSGNRYAENEDTIADEEIDDDWFEAQENDTYDYTGIPKTRDPWNNGQGLQATLSPQAVDTIYELYLQGWTVRDISKRFGILPARTKFCIWVRAQLYHEIIPKLGVKYYLRALRFQERWNQEKAFCDYGLDIEELSNAGILEEITEWNGKMLDAQRKEDQYLGAMKKLQKENKFNKYEMVEVGTLGTENAKYRLKEWKVFRGKGSDQYFIRRHLLRELTRAQKKFNKQYY